MPEITFTPEQRRAIETTGRAVLVTAAAGSGKTAVLAERCAYLVCDAPSGARCEVDRLLVLTFTEAAAAEMRERIIVALRDRIRRSPGDARLQEQLILADAAHISTVHAFCGWVIRRWFTIAGIDPSAQIIEAEEASVLRFEVLANLFRGLYGASTRDTSDDAERPPAADPVAAPADSGIAATGSMATLAETFLSLVEVYGLGQDQAVGKFVLQLDAFLGSLPDPDDWLATARKKLIDGSGCLIHALVDALRKELALHEEHGRIAAAMLRAGHSAGHHHGDTLAEYADDCRAWLDALGPGAADSKQVLECFEAVRARIVAYEFPKGPGKRAPSLGRDASEAATAARELSKNTRDQARRWFDHRLRRVFSLFSAEELAAGLAAMAPYASAMIDLTVAFHGAYTRTKRLRNVLDFGDLERLAHQVLSDPMDGAQPSETAIGLRQRFVHVLVDEFQDINPLQDAIIRLVSRSETSPGGGNLFVVGDVKQSIYRFRLAEPAIFTDRLTRLRDGRAGEVIALQANYRSRPPILETVNLLFGALMQGEHTGVVYDEEAELRPGRVFAEQVIHAPVECHLLASRPNAAPGAGEETEDSTGDEESDDEGGGAAAYHADSSRWKPVEREAYLIGSMIRGWQQAPGSADGSGSPRLGDIVILLRAKRVNAERMANILKRMGVPARADVGGSLFDTREGRDVLSALRVLDNPRQDIPLASVMRSGIFGEVFSVDELAEIRCLDRTAPFYVVAPWFAGREAGTDSEQRVRRLLTTVHRLRAELQQRPVAEVLAHLLDTHGYLAYVGALPNGEQRRANILQLLAISRRFGDFRRQGLRRFLTFVDGLHDHDHSISEAPTTFGTEDVVRIMSIHQAKGLQFPVVFVAGLGASFNLEDRSGRMIFGRDAHIGLRVVDPVRMIEYPSVAHRLVVHEIERTSREEELRVLYVAMTRAQEKLILVGTADLPSTSLLGAYRTVEVPSRLSVSSATAPLDWIMPVLLGAARDVPGESCVRRFSGSGFAGFTYAEEDMKGWRLNEVADPARRSLLQAVSTGEALPPEEPLSVEKSEADEVAARLDWVYPFSGWTAVRAAMAASEFNGLYDFTSYTEQAEVSRAGSPFEVPPSKYLASDRPGPARRGSTMHTVLQHLDFGIAGVEGGLARELQRIRAAGLIGPAEAGDVDEAALAWFVSTPLAAQIQRAGERYRREFAFVASETVTGVDSTVRAAAEDFVLVRGIVDGILPIDDHVVILDFKTDAIRPEQVEERVTRYQSQLATYARAVRRLWMRPVATGYLVFLSARTVRAVELPA